MQVQAMVDMIEGSRRYGGRTVGERKAERRQRFLDAAIQLFAERGYASCSLADVCAAARLSKRQFYEEFGTREDVLAAAYDLIQDEAAQAVVDSLAALAVPGDPALALRAGLVAYLESIGGEPHRAKIIFVETVGVSDRMERRRRLRGRSWAEQIHGLIGIRPRGGDTQIAAALLIGAVNGIAHAWIQSEFRLPVTDLVEVATEVAVAIMGEAN